MRTKRVKAKVSFVARIGDRVYRAQAGDELDMPAEADWLKADLVEAVTTAKTRKKTSSK